MTDSPSSSALREARDHVFAPPVLAGMVGVWVILVISGPFRTLDLLGPGTRAIYWATVVFGTYATGTVVAQVVARRARKARVPAWHVIWLGGICIGIAVTVVLLAIDLLVLQSLPRSIAEVGRVAGIAIVIACVPLTIGALIRPPAPVQVSILAPVLAPVSAAARPPLVLERLPLGKRGQILGFSVQDHYVQIMTSAGKELVLMRLADAIREAGDLPGLQVHRSHWVATGGVTGVRRTGETAILTLSNGTEVPVSRRYIKDLRQAGLLPFSASQRVR